MEQELQCEKGSIKKMDIKNSQPLSLLSLATPRVSLQRQDGKTPPSLLCDYRSSTEDVKTFSSTLFPLSWSLVLFLPKTPL
jgi:hypothetical protein